MFTERTVLVDQHPTELHSDGPGDRTASGVSNAILTALALIVGSTFVVGCNPDTAERQDPSEAVWSFQAEQNALPDFNHDSGYLPEASPVQVRLVLASIGKLTLTADGAPSGVEMVGVKDSGLLQIDGGVTFKLNVKAALGAIQFEGPLKDVPSLELKFENSARFTPFLVGESVNLITNVPSTTLATIPLAAAMGIPAAKGDLVIDAGGTLDTTLTGLCAAVKNGVAHYIAETQTSGTLNLRPRLEISALMINKVVGPFDIPVAIPVIKSRLDLGAIELSGKPSNLKPCDDLGHDIPFVDASTPDSSTSDSETPSDASNDTANPDSSTPEADAREPAPCPLGTLDHCLHCGDVCLGQGLVGTVASCGASGCTIECDGDAYDVNGDPTDGCEAMDDQKNNHSMQTAFDMGDVTDCDAYQTAGGTMPSDGTQHASSPFSRTDGREDWFALYIEDKVCVMEGLVNIDLTALPTAALYEASAFFVCDHGGGELQSKLGSAAGGEHLKVSIFPFDCPNTTNESGTLYVQLYKVSGPHSVAAYSISIKP